MHNSNCSIKLDCIVQNEKSVSPSIQEFINCLNCNCPIYLRPQSSHKAGTRGQCPNCRLKFTHGEPLSPQQISEKLDYLYNVLPPEELSPCLEHLEGGDA